MKKYLVITLSLLLFGGLFLNFKLSRFIPFLSKKEIKRDFNPNVGIPMCGIGGGLFQFDLIGDGSVPIAPKLEGLGDLHFKVSTDSKEAQEFFDQGYRLLYAFNHAEAQRSFQEAVRLDPNLAMAYWGQAYAVGPNINDPLPDMERQKEALKAITKAKALIDKVTPVEAALITALEARCSDKDVEQQELNEAYHQAISKVYEKYPDNPEVATLYGDAVMNTMPWDYWNPDGTPKPHTMECLAALEKAIEINPNHPGARHLYIHNIEAVDPYKAEETADVLLGLMPGAGHMVHMPSHIYIGIGRYDDAVDCNRAAVEADEEYIAACQAQGLYPLVYYPHNLHFLWAAESLLGNSKGAIESAEKVADKVQVSLAADIHFLQDFMSVPIQAYVRFGKWNDILTTPPPGEHLLHATMMWHYARGMALVRKGNLDAAEMELTAVKKIMSDPATETILAAYTNPTNNVGKVAFESLAGEIAATRGDTNKAIEHLSAAAKHEDALAYQEPAAWHAPVRHYLGALLVEAGRMADAEQVYRKDLEKNKLNGWSLFGLHQCLVAQGKREEAAKVKKKFEKAWARADIALTSSRL
ncbi:MAG: hypothetical protein OEM26_07610 [Saprospiraceae bacterium]|nr:hypothetical protein [Saprospiraceae bacterium]